MTRQVLNHDDSIVGRDYQGLMTLVEKPRPQGGGRSARVCGRAMSNYPRNRQAGEKQKSSAQHEPRTSPRRLHRRHSGRCRHQRFQHDAALRLALRDHQQRTLLKMVGGIDRNIFAAWNAKAKLLLPALLEEILVQTVAELAGVVPYYIVFAGMVPRSPSKDVNADLMLADFGGFSGNLPLTHVEKKAREQNGFRKAPAGDDTLSQLPAGLRGKIKNRFPGGRNRHFWAEGWVFCGRVEIWN